MGKDFNIKAQNYSDLKIFKSPCLWLTTNLTLFKPLVIQKPNHLVPRTC